MMNSRGEPSRQSQAMASRFVRRLRQSSAAYDRGFACYTCGKVPRQPITGICGHTRCGHCAVGQRCPCGAPAPRRPAVDVLVQRLIERASVAPSLRTQAAASRAVEESPQRPMSPDDSVMICEADDDLLGNNAKACLDRGRKLFKLRRYRDALVPLAVAAVRLRRPVCRTAKKLLALALDGVGPQSRLGLMKKLYGIRPEWAGVLAEELECPVCRGLLRKPVVTPCGHTYCRQCLERTLDYRDACPLCSATLRQFNLTAVKEGALASYALSYMEGVEEEESKPDPRVLPVFVCTVAFPQVPCPLFIFEPRYRLMIRRCLESGDRRFGMVCCDGESFSNYGTVLEVRDCVLMEDGRSILSTIGQSRFRVMRHSMRDGYHIAHIEPLRDLEPRPTNACTLSFHKNVRLRVCQWLMELSPAARAQIRHTFGAMPSHDAWCKESDGPGWLWWTVAILPLANEIKVMILATEHISKRLMAVIRTLDVLGTASYGPPTNEQERLSNAESERYIESSV